MKEQKRITKLNKWAVLIMVWFAVIWIGYLREDVRAENPSVSHTHAWFSEWTGNTGYHWHECVGDGVCPAVDPSQKEGFGQHIYAIGGHVCRICGYDAHLGYNAHHQIPAIHINVTQPAVGVSPYTECISENVFLAQVNWYPDLPDAYFQPGVSYKLEVTVECAAGYMFHEGAPVIAMVNGINAAYTRLQPNLAMVSYTFPPIAAPMVHTHAWLSEWTGNQNYHWHECVGDGICTAAGDAQKDGYGQHIYAEWGHVCRICGYDAHLGYNAHHPVAEIKLNVSKPAVGLTQSVTCLSNPVYVTQVNWYPALSGGRFEPGVSYKVEVQTAPYPGYVFDANVPAAVSVNDMNAVYSYVDANCGMVSFVFESVPVSQKPTEPTESDEIIVTIPVTVDVVQWGLDAPIDAEFHFAVSGMDALQKYEFIDDVVHTDGLGITTESISITVPNQAELDRLVSTGFNVRERSAIVDGWSFAGEAYHVSLSAKGDKIEKVTPLRETYSVLDGFDGLYFRNYYNKNKGKEGQTPALMLPVIDLLREAFTMETGLYRGTVKAENGTDMWELNWSANKSGDGWGNVNATFSRKDGEKTLKSVSVGDVLYITQDGMYIKLGELCDAYEKVTGITPDFADVISDGWIRLAEKDITRLNIAEMVRVFDQICVDLGVVVDQISAFKVQNGYRMETDEEVWDEVTATALAQIQDKHTSWYELALKAAVSDDVKALIDEFETAFIKAEEQAADSQDVIKWLSDNITVSVEEYKAEWMKDGEGKYHFKNDVTIHSQEKCWIFDSIIVAETASALQINIPENAVSGADVIERVISDNHFCVRLWDRGIY